MPASNPKYKWPRVAELAAKYDIAPITEHDWPLIGAYGDDGAFYDVARIVDAFRASIARH